MQSQNILIRLNTWIIDQFKSLWERRTGQISALDGLRALAITLVIASHSKNDFVHAGGLAHPTSLFLALGYGWIGVDLFFVLSGFLIGRILLTEFKITGTVEVGSFLAKRGLRIWPLYYFVCLITFSKLVLSHHTPEFGQIFPDLFFLTNFYKENLAFGSWSLAIEEQFYILAALFFLFFRKWLRSVQKQTFSILCAVLLLAPLIRMVVWKYHISTMDPFSIEWDVLHNYIFTHYDGLAMGMLFAVLTVFSRFQNQEVVTRILVGFTVFVGCLTYFYRLWFLYSFITLFFGTAVWYCLHESDSKLARFFSNRVFQVVSRLSYGMYLWYRFPLWRIARFSVHHFTSVGPVVQYSLIFAGAFVFAVATAALSYVFIERPFLALRRHLFERKLRTPVTVGSAVMNEWIL